MGYVVEMVYVAYVMVSVTNNINKLEVAHDTDKVHEKRMNKSLHSCK